MKSIGLSFFTDTHLSLIGLMIFFSLFLIILFLQVKSYNKDKIKHLEKLPFEGENDELG